MNIRQKIACKRLQKKDNVHVYNSDPVKILEEDDEPDHKEDNTTITRKKTLQASQTKRKKSKSKTVRVDIVLPDELSRPVCYPFYVTVPENYQLFPKGYPDLPNLDDVGKAL
eukprot:UN08680